MRDHLLALSRPYRHAAVGWKAIARQLHMTLGRFPWTGPTKESTIWTYCLRLPRGKCSGGRTEPQHNVISEHPHEAFGGCATAWRGAERGRAAIATVADWGRPEASHALSGVPPDWYGPWSQQGATLGPVSVVRNCVTLYFNVCVHLPCVLSLDST